MAARIKVLIVLVVFCMSVKATWTPWTSFSSCSLTCGHGYKSRYRSCEGVGCDGPGYQITPCDMGPCHPFDDYYFYYNYFAQTSVWSRWTRWSKCSATCGRGGQRLRKRWCLDYSGKVVTWKRCHGEAVVRSGCDAELECPAITTKKVAEQKNIAVARPASLIDFDEIIDLKTTTTTPATTTTTTTTTTPTTTTPPTTTTTTPPPTTTTPPRVDGGWGEWGDFSHCDVICGGGKRNRKRFCNLPEPSGGGWFCDGDDEEEDGCRTADCYSWGKWGDYGGCGVTCGNGTKTRWRTCEPNFEEAILKNIPETEKVCEGSSKDTESCVMAVCRDCSINNGNCAHTCLSNGTSHVCACDEGYELAADDQSCDDINECELSTNSCDGWCINGVGSYFCFCLHANHYWDLTQHKCIEYKRPT